MANQCYMFDLGPQTQIYYNETLLCEDKACWNDTFLCLEERKKKIYGKNIYEGRSVRIKKTKYEK